MRTPIYGVVGIHKVVLLPAMRTPIDILWTISPYVAAYNIAVAATSHLLKLVIGQLVAFRLRERQNIFQCFALMQLIPLLLRQIFQIHPDHTLTTSETRSISSNYNSDVNNYSPLYEVKTAIARVPNL